MQWAEALHVQWCAAGCDPAAFWSHTIRGVFRVLRGAGLARRRAYTDTLLAAWNGARASATELRDLVDEVSQADGPRKQLPPQALAAALSSMANKLGAISMAEYRARVWGRK